MVWLSYDFYMILVIKGLKWYDDFALLTMICWLDMSSTAFIEPLPVVEFVAQVLGRDVSLRPLSDADRVKVEFVI